VLFLKEKYKEANMGYIKAEEILPIEVIELIQQYVDGTNIYIPRKENNRVEWGHNNQAKEKINQRNQRIYCQYLNGSKVDELSRKFYLSDKSIWRIIRNMKNAG
jgi:Mor family transcriptional regulator